MGKKDIFVGFLIGISANIAGVLLYASLFSSVGIDETLNDAMRNGYVGKIIALGAILNFLPFFLFLKKKQPFYARGVLLATISVAVLVAIIKFV